MSVSKTFKRHAELLIRIQVTWDTYPFDESGGWWACANLVFDQSTLDNCNLQLVTNRYCSSSSFVLVCVSVNRYENCQIWHLLWWSLNFSKYVFSCILVDYHYCMCSWVYISWSIGLDIPKTYTDYCIYCHLLFGVTQCYIFVLLI